VAYKAQASIIVKTKTFHNRIQKQSHKTIMLNKTFKPVKVNSFAKQNSLSPDQEIKEIIVVYNGGDEGITPPIPPHDIKWNCYRISSGALWIQDTVNNNIGLRLGSDCDTPTFI
jgi:hypothetical protein